MFRIRVERLSDLVHRVWGETIPDDAGRNCWLQVKESAPWLRLPPSHFRPACRFRSCTCFKEMLLKEGEELAARTPCPSTAGRKRHQSFAVSCGLQALRVGDYLSLAWRVLQESDAIMEAY